MPKLLLITASSDEIRRARKSRFLNFQQITMPYLAARVPSGWQVNHVDEEAEEIDWRDIPDVVGITFHTPSAYHAYGLAAQFRSRGACVVMGGPHVTLLPEEAGQHADVIFVGEAEGLWEEFLDGFVKGNYRRLYQQAAPCLWQVFPWQVKGSIAAATLPMAASLPRADVRTTAIFAPSSSCTGIACGSAQFPKLRRNTLLFKGRESSSGTTTSLRISNMRSSCFVRSRPIGSGGVARPRSTRPEMTNFWTPQPGVDANSCS